MPLLVPPDAMKREAKARRQHTHGNRIRDADLDARTIGMRAHAADAGPALGDAGHDKARSRMPPAIRMPSCVLAAPLIARAERERQALRLGKGFRPEIFAGLQV